MPPPFVAAVHLLLPLSRQWEVAGCLVAGFPPSARPHQVSGAKLAAVSFLRRLLVLFSIGGLCRVDMYGFLEVSFQIWMCQSQGWFFSTLSDGIIIQVWKKKHQRNALFTSGYLRLNKNSNVSNKGLLWLDPATALRVPTCICLGVSNGSTAAHNEEGETCCSWSCFRAGELTSRGAFACTQLDDMDKMSGGQLIFTVFSSRTFHVGHV